MAEPVCFIDTETDGVRPDRRVWEIAMIRRDDSGETEESIIVVDSGVTGKEEPIALEINHYRQRFNDLSTSTRMTGALAAAAVEKLTAGAWFVAAQPSFDAHSLSRLLLWYGREPQWKRRLRDIESMVAGHLGWNPGGLQDCAKAMGLVVPPSRQHTALGDALVVRDLYRMVMIHEVDW